MSETLYTLSEDALRRIVRQTLKEERTALDSAGLQRSRGMVYAKPQDGVLFRNESQETVPIYAPMELTDYDTANNCWVIGKPTTQRNGSAWLVNRGQAVANGSYGKGDFGFDKPIKVRHAGDGTVVSNWMAPKPSAWGLTRQDSAADGLGFYSPLYGDYAIVEDGVRVYWCQQLREPFIVSTVPAVFGSLRDTSGSSASLNTASTGESHGYAYFSSYQFSGGVNLNYRTGIEYPAAADPYTNGTIQFLRDGLYRVTIRIAGSWGLDSVTTDYENSTPDTTTSDGTPAHTHQVTVPYPVFSSTPRLTVAYRIGASAVSYASSPGSYNAILYESWKPPVGERFTRYLTFDAPAGEGDKLWLVVHILDGEQNHTLGLIITDSYASDVTTTMTVTRLRDAQGVS